MAPLALLCDMQPRQIEVELITHMALLVPLRRASSHLQLWPFCETCSWRRCIPMSSYTMPVSVLVRRANDQLHRVFPLARDSAHVSIGSGTGVLMLVVQSKLVTGPIHSAIALVIAVAGWLATGPLAGLSPPWPALLVARRLYLDWPFEARLCFGYWWLPLMLVDLRLCPLLG